MTGMKECPECRTDVPEEGNFCPQCGTQLADTHSARKSDRRDDWGTGEDDEGWKYPLDETGPQLTDHRLLVAGVVGLAVIGLIEGAAQVLYADTLVELAQEEFGIDEGISAGQLVGAGAIGILISLAVAGTTAYVYTENELENRYFWVLVGSGVAGFLFAQSIFLAGLTVFGIYGLVVVLD